MVYHLCPLFCGRGSLRAQRNGAHAKASFGGTFKPTEKPHYYAALKRGCLQPHVVLIVIRNKISAKIKAKSNVFMLSTSLEENEGVGIFTQSSPAFIEKVGKSRYAVVAPQCYLQQCRERGSIHCEGSWILGAPAPERPQIIVGVCVMSSSICLYGRQYLDRRVWCFLLRT